MIEFACPHCAAAIRVGDNLAGKRGKCHKCGESLSVPTSSSMLPPPISARPVVDTPTPVSEAPRALFTADAPAPSVVLPSNLQYCPDCPERISKRAVACPHCGCPLNPAPATTQAALLVPSLAGQMLTVVGMLGMAFFWFVYPGMAAPDMTTFNFPLALDQLLGVICCATLAIVSSAPTTVKRK